MITFNVTKLSDKNSSWEIQLEPTATINDLKFELLFKEQEAIEEQSLFTSTDKMHLFIEFGTELFYDSTLTECSIQDGTTVFAVYSSPVTMCGIHTDADANGFYYVWGLDPGGNIVYKRPLEEKVFTLSYYYNAWSIALEDPATLIAMTGATIRDGHVYNPYAEPAYESVADNSSWLNHVLLIGGEAICGDTRYDRFTTETESGENRHRRLRVLGFNV